MDFMIDTTGFLSEPNSAENPQESASKSKIN